MIRSNPPNNTNEHEIRTSEFFGPRSGYFLEGILRGSEFFVERDTSWIGILRKPKLRAFDTL